jgi:MFS family permease
MVSLVQVAMTLPMFLLALPAGAFADIVDRRRLLLTAQLWMLFIAALLGVLTVAGVTTAWALIGLTFALGVGAALNGPAWQAIVLDVVPRSELSSAVSLNSAAFNIARAIGPTIGGFLVAAAGPGAVFLLNAVSFVGVIIVLFRWRRPKTISTLPAERVLGAMRTGLRYVRHTPALQAVFIRTVSFVVFASALWPMLPLIARFELGGKATTYGILLGFFGAGSVGGAVLLPRIRRSFSLNTLVAVDTLIAASAILSLAFVRSFGLLCVTMTAAGVAWLTLLSTFNACTQSSVPVWVRGRALSVYLLVFFGSLTGGNAMWGAIAKYTHIQTALAMAGVGMLVVLAATRRYHLPGLEGKDLDPAKLWQTTPPVGEFNPEQGPVVVMVEYLIEPANASGFLDAMRDVGTIRRRDGAVQWGLTRDTTDPGRYVELYVTESWTEHLRQHERLTVADRAAFERAHAYHTGGDRPRVSHLLFAYQKGFSEPGKNDS